MSAEPSQRIPFPDLYFPSWKSQEHLADWCPAPEFLVCQGHPLGLGWEGNSECLAESQQLSFLHIDPESSSPSHHEHLWCHPWSDCGWRPNLSPCVGRSPVGAVSGSVPLLAWDEMPAEFPSPLYPSACHWGGLNQFVNKERGLKAEGQMIHFLNLWLPSGSGLSSAIHFRAEQLPWQWQRAEAL